MLTIKNPIEINLPGLFKTERTFMNLKNISKNTPLVNINLFCIKHQRFKEKIWGDEICCIMCYEDYHREQNPHLFHEPAVELSDRDWGIYDN